MKAGYMREKIKRLRKLVGYVPPTLTVMEIELEQVIARSNEITTDTGQVCTDTWQDINLSNDDITLEL